MARAATAAWPREAAGALGGHRKNGHFDIRHAIRTENRAGLDRFEIPPEAVAAADRNFRERGYELLGFFHSHPHAPGQTGRAEEPSALDVAGGWPEHLTVIVATDGQRSEAPETFVIDKSGNVTRCHGAAE